MSRADGCCVDWAITMLFYSALHYIDAFLDGKGMHPRNHTVRDDEIQNNGSIKAIYRDYRFLKHRSRAARYEIANYTEREFTAAQKSLEAIKQLLGFR